MFFTSERSQLSALTCTEMRAVVALSLLCIAAVPTAHGSRLCPLALRGGTSGSAPESVDSGQPAEPEEAQPSGVDFAARVQAAAAKAAAESVDSGQGAAEEEAHAPVDFAAALEAARARMSSGGSKQSAMAAASHALLGQLRPSRLTAVPDTALYGGWMAIADAQMLQHEVRGAVHQLCAAAAPLHLRLHPCCVCCGCAVALCSSCAVAVLCRRR